MIDYQDLFNRSQGWCSIPKMEAMWKEINAVIDKRENGNAIIAVELGVFGARSIIPIAMALKERGVEGMVYGIDPWVTYEATKGYEGENQFWWSKIDLPEILKQAHILVGHYELNNYVTFLTSSSDNAARLFKYTAIDFFHCDAQHVFEQFKKDIDNYASQCHAGTPIIVDDVGWCGGKEASGYVSGIADYQYSIEDCGFFLKK